MITKTRVKQTFYKVLNSDGCSPIAEPHLRWSLPISRWSNSFYPGMWHTVVGKLRICRNGLHLVRNPKAIAYLLNRGVNYRVFACEVRGDSISTGLGDDRKYAYRTVRLVREVPRGSAEWNLALKGTSYENIS